MTLMTSNVRAEEAKRGEVWTVKLDPTVGAEMKKPRRAIIISSDGLNSLPIRLVVPTTGWKQYHENNLWHIPIEPTVKNGFEKKSTADVLQTRCVSTKRFIEKKGRISAEIMEEIVAALAAIIEHA